MKKLVCLLMALLVVGSLRAQMSGAGAYPFSSFDNKGFDSINLGNLNTMFAIPIVSRPGRGMAFSYTIRNEGLIWQPVKSGSTTAWVHDPAWGFNGALNGTSFSGYLTSTRTTGDDCPVVNGEQPPSRVLFTNYIYNDPFGVTHRINYTRELPCVGSKTGVTTTGDGSTSDGSGYTLVNGTTIRTRSGAIITPGSSATGQDPTNIIDTNGNIISKSAAGTFTDTLGVAALTISGSGPISFTYPVTLQSDSTTTASSTLSYKEYTVQTNFQCSGVVEFGSTSANLVDRITLADGTFYAFTYEPTPGVSGAVTARLASIALPTGGVINYAYTGGCNGSGINPDGTTSSLTRITTDGKKTYVRTTVNANATSTTVTDEKNNVSVFQFSEDSSTSQFYETHRQIYQGSVSTSNLLLDQYTCYNGATAPCDGATVALPILITTTVSSYNGGSQATTSNVYNALGLLTNSATSAGTTTLTITAIAYNGFGEVTSSTTSDGSGDTISSASYGYDETTPTATSGIPQHTAPGTAEGNLTSEHISTGGSILTSTTSYYDTGAPVSTIAPDGGKTTYGYDATQAFATTTTLPTPSSGVVLSTSASYDTQSAMPLSATGANSGQTASVITYDRLLRPLAVSLPNGGTQSFSYSANQSGIQQLLNPSKGSDTETLYDGYGRVSRVAVANGQSTNPWYQTDYCYDASGLLQFQSVSYSGIGWGTTKQCSGAGTTYGYDALGRITSTQNSDGTATTTYTSRAVLTKDVNGVQRITQYDLLGRPLSICEISSVALNGVAPGNCGQDISGTGFLTSYAYNLANHTTTVTQGQQTRTFQADSAGRPTSTTEPERGTTSYSYAYNSTGLLVSRKRPKANQTNATVFTTTTTQYDTLGRVVSVSYDDGVTPTKSYFYDATVASQQWTNSSSNAKGVLAAATSGSGATLTRTQFNYDLMGNVTSMLACAPSICATSAQQSRAALSFGYDWAGNLTGESDAISGSIAYIVSPAGEVTSITNQSYTDPTNTPQLVSTVVNGPQGPTSYKLGNGLQVNNTFDSLGRFNQNWVCSGTSQTNCTGGTKLFSSNSGWKGSRDLGLCDQAVNQCVALGYDDFNRLTSRTITSGTGANFSYTYDLYGNRLQQNVTSGSGPTFSLSVNPVSNHINSLTYDAAGNVTNDGFHSYTYDAEGNVLNVDNGTTGSYVYDALNRRVRIQTASATYEYLFDMGGRRISRWIVASNSGDEGKIYWGNQPIAYRGNNGQTFFEHQDILGTERARTNYQGQLAMTSSSLSFGDGFTKNVLLTGGDQDIAYFTDIDKDAESSTDHATFRQYSSTLGRWMSPDPYDGSYNLTSPQSLNRYSYVLNNPLTLDDPTGLHWECSSSGIVGDSSSGSCVWVDDNNSVTAPPPWYISEYGGTNCGSAANLSYQCSGTPAPTAPSKVGCGTVLPNGQTVGSVVRQQRAILQNAFNASAAQAQTGTPSNPLGYQLGAFTAIVGPNGPIDFKKGQTGQTFVQMGLAGNFAYYAIGAGFFGPTTLDLGAGAYALTAAAFFPHSTVHFSDLTGNFFSDSAAAQMRGPGLAAGGCSVP